MMTDRYGLDLATPSDAARGAYVEACDLLLTMYPGAAEAFDRAIAADPGFDLAWAGKARALMLAGEMPGAKAALAEAQARAADERARSHAGVFALMLAGRPGEALDAVRAHLAAWPRDALVAATAANQLGLIATSGRAKREEELRDFLATLAPQYGDDWWFNGHYGMALSETGDQAEARPRLERSITAQPRNATAAHAVAHFHYENGEHDEATAFLRPWLAQYPRQGGMHGHISWHLALVLLQQGDVEGGFRLFTEAFGAEEYFGPALVKLLDTTSYLWRAELAGYPRDEARWQAVAALVETSFPRPGMPYTDWHVALADAVADGEAAEGRRRTLEEMAREGRYNAGGTVAALSRAFAAFERGDHAAAIAAIGPVLPERERISGSRAQIDLVEFTLLKAYLASGRIEDARRLVAARRPGPHGVPVAGAELLFH